MTRHARHALQRSLLAALVAVAMVPCGVGAQRATPVGVRSHPPLAWPARLSVASPAPGARPDAPGKVVGLPGLRPAHRSKSPYLWGGALLGAAAAGLAHVLYIRQLPKEDDYRDLNYLLVPGSVVVGAGLGTGAGYVVYRAAGR
jgi:hypothetical protein